MSGKVYLNNTQFFKPTYFKALRYILPKYLIEDDLQTFGEEVDLQDQIINTHIDVASSISSVINVSAIPGTIWSGINTLSGIIPYFIKQNGLTNITPEVFETKILNTVGRSLNDFSTSSQFSDYLENTLLSSIRLNNPTAYFSQGQAASATHVYLNQYMTWIYWLNSSGTSYNPSSFVKSILIEKTFNGQPILLNDCMQGLTEFLWRNENNQFIPESFLSSTGTFTSGIQQLDKLKTWIDVVYSPLYADRSDFKVKDRFDLWVSSRLKIEDKSPDGPFSKLLRMLSFAAFDINNDTELLKSIYDIEECPDEFLPLIAELIGWKLFGTNPSRWRLQLRNAVEVYKKVGTKRSIQFALNSVFPKDQFSIESRITELWESYIPYLIYYSLATESSYFSDNSTWTRQIANNMNINTYSVSSIDENIRLAVDRIILETTERFPSKFNIPNAENQFSYRGRTYPIPPFEEYPYYVNVELDQEMVDFIIDRLVCFGVREAFALQVRDYIVDNTIDVDEEVRSNSWLFFTSGYNEAPNVSSMIPNLHTSKFEYVSLWNGKSSHFKLVFDASEFDFANLDESSIDSGDAVVIASKIVSEFAPAHAIPLINLQLSAIDRLPFDYDNSPIYDFDQTDFGRHLSGLSNYYTSGLHINSYKRGVNPTGNRFGRTGIDSLQEPLFLNATNAGAIPRDTFRRRSYEKLMPQDGYYDRTGFNMPVSWLMASSLSGIPLGFIPSANAFQSISDVGNLPDIYSKCQTINSSASFYGYNVSSALRARGTSVLGLDDIYVDRGQLPDIYATMHFIGEHSKTISASSFIEDTPLLDFTWKNVALSYANSATETSGWFPTCRSDYYNFAFGRDYHQYYRNYTDLFERHRLSENLHSLDGPNIFAHTFGSILRNSTFEILGPYAGSYVTSSLSSIIAMSNGGSLFSIAGSTIGTFVASSTSSMYVDTFEYVNSGVLAGVELVQTSGSMNGNGFKVFRIPSSDRNESQSDYMFDNTFLFQKSFDGLGRFRFDLKTYSNPSSEGHVLSGNFLNPDHKFNFSVRALASTDDGLRLGGKSIGIWIHTKSEGGNSWTFTPGGEWIYHNSLLDKQDLLDNYVHRFDFKNRDRLIESAGSSVLASRLNCIEFATPQLQEISPLLTFDENDFESFEVNFNTINRKILLPESYLKIFGQLHRKNQNYIVEVFQIPDQVNTDRFVLFDRVNLVDSTLNTWSKVLVSGVPLHDPLAPKYCPEYRLELSKLQVQSILRFWNNICGKNSLAGLASRDASEVDGVVFNGEGSRLDFRILPSWTEPVYYGAPFQNLIIEQLFAKL